MIKIIYFLVLLLFVAGCSEQETISKLEQTNNTLRSENKDLQRQDALKDQFIEAYTTTVNEVYENIERITKRERLIDQYAADVEKRESENLKDRMLNNIESIDSYIKESKNKINKLQEKIYRSKLQMTSVEETMQDLREKIKEKESYIVELKQKLQQMTDQMADMETAIKEKDQKIQEQTKAINTAYYIVAGEKELKNKGIIEEKGGILGIRQTKKLTDHFNPKDFLITDISATTAIPIENSVGDVKIISPHSPDSYILTQQGNKTMLEILKPQEFWKIKYLVVLTKS